MLPSVLPKLGTDSAVRGGFLVFGNFSLFKTPFPGWNSVPPSFVSFFVFYIFSYLLSKSWAAFLGAWCPLPAFRSCFVEFPRCLNALLMNLWGRKCSPHPTPPPSWLLPPPTYGIYMFQCYSSKSSHLRLLPQSPKVCLFLCLFCCLAYRVIITIFLNSIYIH